MSTIKALVPYHSETSGRQTGQNPSRDGQGQAPRQSTAPREDRRQPAFLVQVLVGVDADLRKALGRRDLAEQRLNAYGSALASRPSARPLSFLRLVETA